MNCTEACHGELRPDSGPIAEPSGRTVSAHQHQHVCQSARLPDLPANDGAPSPSPSTRTSLPSTPDIQRGSETATEEPCHGVYAHNALDFAGGRPSHPLHLIGTVPSGDGCLRRLFSWQDHPHNCRPYRRAMCMFGLSTWLPLTSGLSLSP